MPKPPEFMTQILTHFILLLTILIAGEKGSIWEQMGAKGPMPFCGSKNHWYLCIAIRRFYLNGGNKIILSKTINGKASARDIRIFQK
jgi:hypothetical protein